MTTVAIALALCSALAYSILLIGYFIGLRRLDVLGRAERAAWKEVPVRGVSILKPCAGIDQEFERCIESFFVLRDPNFEIVFGVRDRDDPAIAVIDRVRARHPNVDVAIVVTGAPRHPSPKISNMAVMAGHARHELFWLSDSNTEVTPDTLTGLRATLARPGVGMVVSPIAATGERTIGSTLDNLEINAWVMFGAIAAHERSGLVGGPGKSVLIHRDTLERAGGWELLGRFFGEDTVLMSAVREMGLALALGPDMVFHPNERASLQAFGARHLRWLLIRLRLYPLSIVGELLSSPWFVALCAAAYLARHERPWSAVAIAVFGAAVQMFGDLIVSRSIRGSAVPLRFVPLVLVRPLAVAALSLRAIVRSDVRWRGVPAWVGPRSAILFEPGDTAYARVIRWIRSAPPTTPMPDLPDAELLEPERAPRRSASALRS